MKEIVMQRTKNVSNSAVYIYTADAAQSCANDSRLQRIVTDESAGWGRMTRTEANGILIYPQTQVCVTSHFDTSIAASAPRRGKIREKRKMNVIHMHTMDQVTQR